MTVASRFRYGPPGIARAHPPFLSLCTCNSTCRMPGANGEPSSGDPTFDELPRQLRHLGRSPFQTETGRVTSGLLQAAACPACASDSALPALTGLFFFFPLLRRTRSTAPHRTRRDTKRKGGHVQGLSWSGEESSQLCLVVVNSAHPTTRFAKSNHKEMLLRPFATMWF